MGMRWGMFSVFKVWPMLHLLRSHDVCNSLRWRHNGCDSVSNHLPHGCLLNRLFRRWSKKTSKPRVTGLYVWGKWPVARKMFPFDDIMFREMFHHVIPNVDNTQRIPLWQQSFIVEFTWDPSLLVTIYISHSSQINDNKIASKWFICIETVRVMWKQ